MKKIFIVVFTALMLLSTALAENEHHILIAYFTWADNTTIVDAEASLQSALDHYGNMGDRQSGTDATSSASLFQPGNTAIMAGYIQEKIGGDLFSIQVEELYPSNYDECLDRAADELDDDARPTLKTHVENMTQYDIIFLGMPNWWYSCPRAILSFLDEYDLSGKTIVPFVAHGTGGISGSVRDMKAELPKICIVLDPIGVYRPHILTCEPEIEQWLQKLGFMD